MCAMTEKLRMCAGIHSAFSAIRAATYALRVFRTDVFRARPDQAIVGVLLEHVRRPAGNAAHGEDRREEIDRNAERVIGGRRVEVDVRVELLLALHQRFDALRHLEPVRLARPLAELARHLAQMRGPRILGVIHAMAEAGNLLLARQLCADDLVHPLRSGVLANLEQHPHHVGIGAAVQRSLQAPIAPTMAEWRSVSVAAATRAANVDALSS